MKAKSCCHAMVFILAVLGMLGASAMPQAAGREAKQQAEQVWSFLPIRKPEPPRTRFDHLAKNPIDRFVFAKLAGKGLEPSAPAGRLELLRRVTIDLTGLPPTLEEVDRFLNDPSEAAYEKVVDRLLASTAYGERWARHWLDVVRFGESHGYEQNHIRPNAWPYRDYVIRAFNEDKPFPEFIAEQLAGDLVGKGDPNVEAATGFLVAGVHDTVGNQTVEGTLQQRANDLEDIVSTVGAAFLGLTVGCAKCHDHKFDPIPQKDYYRLAAVFAGVRHGERALSEKILTAGKRQVTVEAARRIRRLQDQIADLEAVARVAVLQAQGVKPVPRPAVNSRRNVEDFAPVTARFVRFTVLATQSNTEPCLDELEIYGPDKRANLALASAGAKASASSLLPGYPIHQIHHLNDGKYGNDWSWISNQRGGGWAQIELVKPATVSRIVWSRDRGEPTRFSDRVASVYRVEISLDAKAWKTLASGADRALAPEAIPPETLDKALTPRQRKQRSAWTRELENLRPQTETKAPQRVYTGQFSTPDTIHVLRRGDVMKPRQVVRPGGLSQIPGLSADLAIDPKLGEPGRRLALARWLADPKNPLCARVLVNRIWQYHFGLGLAATPSDFGKNGTPPSHPELLDWLADDFMTHGWRLKRVHKLMVTSYVYRQSSAVGQRAAPSAESKARSAPEIDADNRLLWRMPLRRLEAEALRDAILQVSGKLDRRMGGPGFALFKYRVVNVAIYEPLEEYGPAKWRRGVYALAARSIRDDLMGNFDCPESAQRAPRRDITTTPLQALSLLNGPFAIQQAKFFARRVEKEAGTKHQQQVIHGFRLALGRSPRAGERQAALDLVARRGLVSLCRALLNANEFLYY